MAVFKIEVSPKANMPLFSPGSWLAPWKSFPSKESAIEYAKLTAYKHYKIVKIQVVHKN